MAETITAISWNVQGEIGIGDARLHRQIEFLEEHTDGVDLYLLQAVNSERGTPDGWEGHLGALVEFFEERDYNVTHTGDWARELAESSVQPHADIEGTHNRCNLTASRWPIERRPLSLRNRGDRKPRNLDYYYGHFPEKLLVSHLDLSGADGIDASTLECWNVGIVNGANWGEEKLNMLETVYGRVSLQTSKTSVPVILGGDFNAPKYESARREITPQGKNTAAYNNYPFYGDPHYLRDESGATGEYRFDQRWQLTEARMFDQDVGDWGMRDV